MELKENSESDVSDIEMDVLESASETVTNQLMKMMQKLRQYLL